MYLIVMNNSCGIEVESFVLCVHFIYVGLNCQHERKATPGGIQLCLTLAVSKLMVNSHYGQYLRGTGEMC